ncbi:hypothetical protein [Chlamydia avium]|nr:hypothetical protein [Chlamydia avium]EPP36281.1 hypothetical protein CP10743SC13_0198 [Chlamydia psittaci 10_743_SC13]
MIRDPEIILGGIGVSGGGVNIVEEDSVVVSVDVWESVAVGAEEHI